MKIYNILIQPDVKLHREQIIRLAKEIESKFCVRTVTYDDVFVPFCEESLRMSIEGIAEGAVPDLLMYLDNIAWEGYKIIDMLDIGGIF